MRKMRILDALLWVIIGLSIGVVAKIAFDYAVIETIPVDITEATELFNQEYASLGQQTQIAGMYLSSEPDCSPVFLKRVEKRCVQELTLFTTTAQELVGFCTTWSYKSYVCEIPAEKNSPVGVLAQIN